MPKPTILLVEDDPQVQETLTSNLGEEGFDIVVAGDVHEFQQNFSASQPDVILLDLILPDGDGLQLLKDIRKRTDVPVIIISGKIKTADKIAGLNQGADDYIAKPLQIDEVTARIRAQVRRYNAFKEYANLAANKSKGPMKIRFGEWVLDRKQFQVYNQQGNSARLTIKEYRLLKALILTPERVLTRQQILDFARTGEYDISDRAVDVQIMRIRKKLGDTANRPAIIKAVRGVGYTLVPKTEILQ